MLIDEIDNFFHFSQTRNVCREKNAYVTFLFLYSMTRSIEESSLVSPPTHPSLSIILLDGQKPETQPSIIPLHQRREQSPLATIPNPRNSHIGFPPQPARGRQLEELQGSPGEMQRESNAVRFLHRFGLPPCKQQPIQYIPIGKHI